MSGNFAGRYAADASADMSAARTPVTSCPERLSITTTSPGLKAAVN